MKSKNFSSRQFNLEQSQVVVLQNEQQKQTDILSGQPQLKPSASIRYYWLYKDS